ncbi:hypothetical protein RJ639_028806 [Escallonia herrerae]|uniref:Reverse transcriptase Ty1/copia-type domain-containing protein n=1 Tax=Escallonia herrerae TaxID=1293975 RepID=A0AA88X6N4_9ASTE|nr:hypothetical protein RJ639_028806 [Escallonia herrerae]
MANMIMASSKTIITSSSTPHLHLPPTPKLHKSPQLTPLLTTPLPKPLSLNPTTAFNSLAAILATSLAAAPPSLAEEFEKAQLFDFDLTLPIIAAEFLFLMFALDKLYYSPLGNFMDQRDKEIKNKLSSVKDTSAEVKQLEEQANAVMRAARAEISAALNTMKKETQLEVEKKLAEERKKLEAELQEALAKLEEQKEETIKSLDSQIAALSDGIVKKRLADGSHIYLLYVDDMLIATKSMSDVNSLKEQLKRKFEMKHLGAAKRILGMEIQRDRPAGILYLSQKRYIEQGTVIVEKIFTDENPTNTMTKYIPEIKLKHCLDLIGISSI